VSRYGNLDVVFFVRNLTREVLSPYGNLDVVFFVRNLTREVLKAWRSSP